MKIELIYVIVLIIISVVSSFKKQKKQQKKQNQGTDNTTTSQTIWEEFEKKLTGLDRATATKKQEKTDNYSKPVANVGRKQQNYNNNKTNEQRNKTAIHETLKEHKSTLNTKSKIYEITENDTEENIIISNLSEARQAFIYSEIFNKRY